MIGRIGTFLIFHALFALVPKRNMEHHCFMPTPMCNLGNNMHPPPDYKDYCQKINADFTRRLPQFPQVPTTDLRIPIAWRPVYPRYEPAMQQVNKGSLAIYAPLNPHVGRSTNGEINYPTPHAPMHCLHVPYLGGANHKPDYYTPPNSTCSTMRHPKI